MTNACPQFLRVMWGADDSAAWNALTILTENNFALQHKMTSTFLLIGHLILVIPLFSAGKLDVFLKLLF